jgi:hypothetical protein
VVLDPWLPPAKATKTTTAVSLAERLGLDVSGQFLSNYSTIDSGSADDLPDTVALDAKNKVSVVSPVTSPLNVTKWKVTIAPTTGVFTGSFVLAGSKARTVPFAGIMRQPPSTDTVALDIIGEGHFLLPALPTDTSNEILSGEIQFELPDPD